MSSKSIFTKQVESKRDPNELEIYGKPNRITKFIEITRWYWFIFFLIGSFMAYFSLFAQSIADNEENVYTIEQQLTLVVLLFSFCLLMFAWGLKVGANIYRPHPSYLTMKHLRNINKQLHAGNKVTILAEQPGVLNPKIENSIEEIKKENGN